MQRTLLRRVRAIVLSLGLAAALPAAGSATLTNFTDLWWTPAESGWGLNIAQQADTMYVTFYVYGQNGQPTWYSALLVHQGPQPDGSTLFAGSLDAYTGPYFGAPFNPVFVAGSRVGNATFRATSTTAATLSYNVGTVTVTKAIERFLLREDNLAGSYLGGTSDVTSSCIVPGNNGFVSEESGAFTVAHIGTLMETRSPGCTYTGSHAQQGQVSRFEGNYSCGNGASGSIAFFDLRVEPGGISGRYTGRGSGCDFAGNIGLARRK